MSGIRRAFFFSSLERYAGLVASFATVAAVSRLLTPSEVGVSAVGTALMAIAIALKEFAANGFLIQAKEIGAAEIRTAFTVQFALSLVIAGATALIAPYFAAFYGEPTLACFVDVAAAALIVDA